MKFLFSVILLASFCLAGTITPDLSAELAEAQPDELIPVVVMAVGRADVGYLAAATAGMDRDARKEFVADALKAKAEETQSGMLSYLDSCPVTSVENVRSFWIVNCLVCDATPEVIRELADRADVQYVRYRGGADILIEPYDQHASTHEELNRANAWGVDQIDAPTVWGWGYEGSGVVVSVIDTGVNYNHVDLHNNMWHDTDAGYHYGWDFDDNDADPMDTYGHGTHCAGSVASDGTAGTVCGVAPSATIMALRVGVTFSDEQDCWDAMQFSIDYGADIITMSLGWPQSQSPQRTEWRQAEENVLAAGLFHSVAAGNEGGDPGSWGDIRTPGDCPPPWLHPDQTTTGGLSAVVTVGATDSSDNLASFSSLGYSTWMYDDPWYDYPDSSPDIGLIDPDVCAPGVNITSCDYSNPSGYTTMSGTSMATPHNAGLVALMLDANPALTVAVMDSILEVTALELGSAGKDNYYGAGRIRAPEAVTAALAVGIDDDLGGVPEPGVLLSAVYPNPASSVAFFDVYVPNGGTAKIEVFDLSGRIVDVVSSGQLEAGNHSLSWTVPEDIAGGIYFLRAQGAGQIVTRRLTVLR